MYIFSQKIFIAILVVLGSITLVSADVKKARQAYVINNYETAFYEYSISKNKMDEYDQTRFGYMYDMGYGVEQNYHEAIRWYSKAAAQGYASAQ